MLPVEILARVWENMNFGDLKSKGDLDALRLSCKFMKQALSMYPAVLKLRGQWRPDQLAGTLFLPFVSLNQVSGPPSANLSIHDQTLTLL